MKSRWRRNAVVGTMVVLVCAAAGLNWRYGGGAELTGGRGRLLGEATLVSGKQETVPAESDGTAAPGSGSSGSGASGLADGSGAALTGADYFASARLTRQQARDSAVGLLQEAAGQEGADETVANEASEGIQVLASYTMKEAQIEDLVMAKGYQDCVAFMGDGSVSVVVSNGAGELTGEDVAKITDIAMSETGLPASGVKILAAG